MTAEQPPAPYLTWQGENGDGHWVRDHGFDRDYFARVVRFLLDHRFAVNWTKQNHDERFAKACLETGWENTPPLEGEPGYLAGQFAQRLRTRNPVLVARTSKLILVDADGPDELAAFEKLEAPPTLTVVSSTPDRKHFWFRWDGDMPDHVMFCFENGKVTGKTNGYVLMPPAVHPGKKAENIEPGSVYRFENGTTIATMPASLIEQLQRLAGNNGNGIGNGHAAVMGDVIPLGEVDNTLTSLAGSMRRRGMNENAIYAGLVATLPQVAAGHSHTEADCRRIARSVSRYPAAKPAWVSHTSTGDSTSVVGRPEAHERHDVGQPVLLAPEGLPELNDFGLARTFIAQFGDRFRNINETERWITCRGGRWYERTGGKAARQAAMRTLRSLPEYANLAVEDSYRSALLSYSARALTTAKRNAILDIAANEPEMMTDLSELDTHRMLLACANGTLDLVTGRLGPHSPKDYITKGSPIAYEPAATAPRWEQFLQEVFLGDEELVAYMQRLAGYWLTGSVKEEKFWIFYGSGGNGKSKFANIWIRVLGKELCQGAAFQTFLPAKGDRIPNDLARMDRARLVIASEKKKHEALDEGVIKQVTGGDRITARFMRSEWFDYEPQFKVALLVNEKPIINAADGGIRRRVKMVPFEAEFPQPDLELESKLTAEAEGILAWAVRGCLVWQRDGLGSCAKVDAATGDYLNENHPLSDWLAECWEDAPGHTASGKELRDSYTRWCREHLGVPRLSNSEYGEALKVLYKQTRGKHGVTWFGLRPKGELRLDT
jgi:putative DNA primase/helicase